MILANVSSAVMWGLVAGDTSEGLRPMLLSDITTLIFNMSSLLILQALYLILPQERLSKVVGLLRILVFTAILSLTANLLLNATEIVRAQNAYLSYREVFDAQLPYLAMMTVLMLLALALGALARMGGLRDR